MATSLNINTRDESPLVEDISITQNVNKKKICKFQGKGWKLLKDYRYTKEDTTLQRYD